jgi:ferredoxin
MRYRGVLAAISGDAGSWLAACIDAGQAERGVSCRRDRRTGMANRITEECMSCGACEAECPNQAISQGDSAYVIDPAKCDECAALGGEFACKAVCPNDECIVKL